MESIYALLKRFDSVTKPPISLIQTVVKALRKSKIRRPDITAVYGPKLIEHGGIHGSELFSHYENIFTAAIDHGDYPLADKYLQLLIKNFPNSNRVKRLLGLSFESQGDYNAALGIYDEILKDTPSNLLVMKRKVAVHRAQGNFKGAVESLHEILKLYQSDNACWMELADIHLTLCDYQAASYCFEELILLAPLNSFMHVRLAECLYTIGGMENLVKARKHYSISLNNQSYKTNTRALYGIVMTCKALLQLPSKKFAPNEECISKEMLDWGLARLEERSTTSEVVGAVSRGIAGGVDVSSS